MFNGIVCVYNNNNKKWTTPLNVFFSPSKRIFSTEKYHSTKVILDPLQQYFFLVKKILNKKIDPKIKFFFSLWQLWYYPHRSRDSVSPVCGIFSTLLNNLTFFRTCFGCFLYFLVLFNNFNSANWIWSLR